MLSIEKGPKKVKSIGALSHILSLTEIYSRRIKQEQRDLQEEDI
jgi:hypothetical protein